MTKADFLKNCTINDSIFNEFKTIHPKQLISNEIPVPVWGTRYSYNTARGNHKTAQKYIFDSEYSWDRVEDTFNIYIKKQNEIYPDRVLSNVEILEINYLGEVFLDLE